MTDQDTFCTDAEFVYTDSEMLNFKIKKLLKNSSNVYFTLPYEWHQYGEDGFTGKAVDDPLTIYWVASIEDISIVCKNSFSNLIKEFCDSSVAGDGKITQAEVPTYKNLVNALQKEIDFLNKFIDNATNQNDKDQ